MGQGRELSPEQFSLTYDNSIQDANCIDMYIPERYEFFFIFPQNMKKCIEVSGIGLTNKVLEWNSFGSLGLTMLTMIKDFYTHSFHRLTLVLQNNSPQTFLGWGGS